MIRIQKSASEVFERVIRAGAHYSELRGVQSAALPCARAAASEGRTAAADPGAPRRRRRRGGGGVGGAQGGVREAAHRFAAPSEESLLAHLRVAGDLGCLWLCAFYCV